MPPRRANPASAVGARKDQQAVSYPRAPDKEPDGAFLGLLDIADIAGVNRNTATKWVVRGMLPAADGPSIEGRPTWRRATAVCWLMAREVLPDHLSDEFDAIVKSRQGKALFERLLSERG
jgi:hypothetical protein